MTYPDSSFTPEYVAALIDSNPQEEYCCGHYGPGGSCTRLAGHLDLDADGSPTYDHNHHVSYDSGHYRWWPIGWRPLSSAVSEAINDLAVLAVELATDEIYYVIASLSHALEWASGTPRGWALEPSPSQGVSASAGVRVIQTQESRPA